MLKKAISLLLAAALVIVSSSITTFSAADTNIYFSLPKEWGITAGSAAAKVYCHVQAVTGDTLNETEWQTSDEQCAYDSDTGLYYFNFNAVFGKSMEENADYTVIFSATNRTGTIQAQTYSITMGKSCYGDTLTVTETIYDNPDTSQQGYGAVWSDSYNSAVYGPLMTILSTGEVIGDFWPPHLSASDAVARFIATGFENIESRIENEGYYCCSALCKALGTNAYEVYTSYAALYADELSSAAEIPTLDDVCRYLQCENPPSYNPTAATSASEPTTTAPATEQSAATAEPTTQEPATEEITTAEPTTEEPTTEEPATEEPTTEEPVTDPVDESDFTYKRLKDGTAEITGYSGSSAEMKIPSKIDGYIISGIGNSAFASCTRITSAVIPDSVLTVDDYAFSYCINLSCADIGNNVETIGDYAFFGCSSLKEISIPDSVTSIGVSAFAYCEELESLTIGANVSSIGNYAFDGCTSLTSVTIPEGVTEIASQAFNNCNNLTVYGYAGSAAEAYANENGIAFVALDASSVLIGDVDLDGNITVADATAIQKFVVGTLSLSDEQFKAADANGDGSVTVADATTVQKMAVGAG